MAILAVLFWLMGSSARAQEVAFSCKPADVVAGVMIFLSCADGLYAGGVYYQKELQRYAGILVCTRTDTTPCASILGVTVSMAGRGEPRQGVPYPCAYRNAAVECNLPRF